MHSVKHKKAKGGSNRLHVLSARGEPPIRFDRVEVYSPMGNAFTLWPKGEVWYIGTANGAKERVLHIERRYQKTIAHNPIKFGMLSGSALTMTIAGLFQFIL